MPAGLDTDDWIKLKCTCETHTWDSDKGAERAVTNSARLHALLVRLLSRRDKRVASVLGTGAERHAIGEGKS